MDLKIAFAQLLPAKTLEEQFQIGQKACEKTHALGADITLFPEMWSDGYYLPQDMQELKRLAITKDSDFIQSFGALAKKLEMAICMTFLEKNEPYPLNSMIIFDRNGKEILHYSKVHTCAFDLEKVLSAGENFYVADLDTGRGMVKVGAMICFDREFPESARILMLQGAEVILSPNACPLEINRLAVLRTRAYENMVAVATCNYPEGHPDCNGHSVLFDGVPWLPEEDGARDMCVFDAGAKEGIFVSTLDLDMLRRHRANEVMGNKYRHPQAYNFLVKQ